MRTSMGRSACGQQWMGLISVQTVNVHVGTCHGRWYSRRAGRGRTSKSLLSASDSLFLGTSTSGHERPQRPEGTDGVFNVRVRRDGIRTPESAYRRPSDRRPKIRTPTSKFWASGWPKIRTLEAKIWVSSGLFSGHRKARGRRAGSKVRTWGPGRPETRRMYAENGASARNGF
ncbi:hypothetical protein OH76DRAFT_608262 [Lentinus brumalis]|uniref:Uncharacterized protein n=1 Tax=Lentinus brumalis TaxID=2498619 RepID=A0A371DUL7_9APHY|nr:hypothetical protein OH76DRAFT_608262 [Polyporus brumalis]